jgi:hypothetical protein
LDSSRESVEHFVGMSEHFAFRKYRNYPMNFLLMKTQVSRMVGRGRGVLGMSSRRESVSESALISPPRRHDSGVTSPSSGVPLKPISRDVSPVGSPSPPASPRLAKGLAAQAKW